MRTGKKGERKFRVVVKEKRSKRDGDQTEQLGWYEKSKPVRKKIDSERYKYWIGQGAQPSRTIADLMK
jgi:small subunit ribosomal protein S16